jgi:hypothetical protein
MTSRRHEEVMFETIACCALLGAAAAFVVLIFKLITLGATQLESIARAELLLR